eukprot:56390_1
MGSVLSSNEINTTSNTIHRDVTLHPDMEKRIEKLPCKFKLELIVNCWLRRVNVTLFPIDLKQIIIDTYTYQYEFDNPHYYHASKPDPDRYFPISKRKTTIEHDYTNYFFQILTIGNEGVGKTALQKRFVQIVNDSFDQAWRPGAGLDFRMRTIKCDGKTIKLQIWDTSSISKSITSSYYTNVNGMILCYDLTDPETLNDIRHWNEACITYGKLHVARIMVGTKFDLQSKIKCTKQDAIKMAKECDINYIIETSAKNNINVEKAFNDITQKILNSAEKGTKHPFSG